MICDFEFCCTRQKNGLMSRFFYETWEYNLHHRAKKLFDFLNYIHKKIQILKSAQYDTEDIDKVVITKKCVEAKITDLQYHNVSTHVARILYDSHDEQNGFWS